jgi:hypothetical protein
LAWRVDLWWQRIFFQSHPPIDWLDLTDRPVARTWKRNRKIRKEQIGISTRGACTPLRTHTPGNHVVGRPRARAGYRLAQQFAVRVAALALSTAALTNQSLSSRLTDVALNPAALGPVSE